jgi:hypothetical protein
MTLTKTTLIAASLVLAGTIAQAGTREDLATGYHGNTPVSPAVSAAARGMPQVAVSPRARAAFALSGAAQR